MKGALPACLYDFDAPYRLRCVRCGNHWLFTLVSRPEILLGRLLVRGELKPGGTAWQEAMRFQRAPPAV